MPPVYTIRRSGIRLPHILFVIRFAILALAVCVSGLPARAQTETAEVLGTVRDTTGASVTGAAVTLTNVSTGVKADTTTNADGDYDFLNVAIGDYEVGVEHAGFSKVTTDVRVEVEARQRVDFSLKSAP